MAYQINLTDGTLLSTVPDGQIDDRSTGITLIGKNYSGFGEALNENFVKLLENFSSTAEPSPAVRGQIWYDANESKLKVYNGVSFVPVSSATISESQPDTLGVGDLWYNNFTNQLFFFDGQSPVLIAPIYTQAQGLSGFRVSSVIDIENQTRVITLLYNSGVLLGIFSKDKFTPKDTIDGYGTDEIQPGFNAGNLQVSVRNPITNETEIFPIRFRVTVTNAEKLNNADATLYLRSDTANRTDFQFRVLNDLGVSVGSGGTGSLRVDNGDLIIANSASGRAIRLRAARGIDPEDAIVISPANRNVSFYPNDNTNIIPQYTFNGNVEISGNITVNGTTTTVNSTILTVDDKNIELGAVANPTDTTADTGGIILKGTSNHVFVWSNLGDPAYADVGGGLYSQAWNSSDHLNLGTNKYYAIDGIPLIVQTSDTPGNKTFKLTTAITAVEGVSSFGKQSVVNVGPGSLVDPPWLRLQDNRISTQITDQDLEIAPNGTGNIVLIGSPKITGMADPTSQQDAATKEYVDNVVETKTIILSIDLSDNKPNTYIISNILNNLAPTTEFRVGTVARLLCSTLNNSGISIDLNSLATGKPTATFITDNLFNTGQALTDLTFSPNPAVVSGSTITVLRVIKVFQLILSGATKQWVFVSQTVLPP